MSKQSHQKPVTPYDDDLMLIISYLRSNLKALQAKYKNEITDCLKSVPIKVFDQALRVKLLREVPESLEFISAFKDNDNHVKKEILRLQPKKLESMQLDQNVINSFIEDNIKNIHEVPQQWRNEQTIAHFMKNFNGVNCMEIFEDLHSYTENLSEYDIANLQQQFGILSFINKETSDESIINALITNPFAFHTIPSNLQKEEFKLKVLEINPQVIGSKPVSLSDKIKDACLHILASMNKIQAKDLVNNSWKSLLSVLKERDRKVHIVEDWNFA